MRILLLIVAIPNALLHAVFPRRHAQRNARHFYPHGYMREEVDALRKVEVRK
ncbi:MAG: hypothetical protein H6671_10290 [Anaerolineaceae bacterium]|nr:hypothetical protein [Anaerolineaceae bacterium]